MPDARNDHGTSACKADMLPTKLPHPAKSYIGENTQDKFSDSEPHMGHIAKSKFAGV